MAGGAYFQSFYGLEKQSMFDLMFQYIQKNYEWLFSGIGVAVLSFFVNRIKREKNGSRVCCMTFDDIYLGVKHISKWLKDQDEKMAFSPDIILAMPGGGMLVAELISFEYNQYIKIISAFRIPAIEQKKNGTFEDPIITPKYCYYLPVDKSYLSGKKVLIVDIYLNTGGSVRAFKDFLDKNGVNENDIRFVAVVQTNNHRTANLEADLVYERSKTVDVLWPWGPAIALQRK